jgi:hypothetical protein
MISIDGLSLAGAAMTPAESAKKQKAQLDAGNVGRGLLEIIATEP